MHLKIGYVHIVIEISQFLFHAYLEKEKGTKKLKCQCVTFLVYGHLSTIYYNCIPQIHPT